MLGAKPAHCGIVYTNFQHDFSARLSLIKQGENVILSLLGDGLHDGMAEALIIMGYNGDMRFYNCQQQNCCNALFTKIGLYQI